MDNSIYILTKTYRGIYLNKIQFEIANSRTRVGKIKNTFWQERPGNASLLEGRRANIDRYSYRWARAGYYQESIAGFIGRGGGD